MKKIPLLLLACCLFSICACGYGFRHQQSNLPPDIKTIAIPMFVNKTSEVGTEGIITEQVRFQFTQSQILKLVPKAEADAILLGEVTYITSDDVTLTTRTTSDVRRLNVSIRVKVVRSDNGKVLYSGGASQRRQYMTSANDNTSTEVARREALRLVARDAAQIIHDGVLQNF